MRQSILLWSAFSGVVIGAIAGVLVVGVGAIALALLPPSVPRPSGRVVSTALVLLFGVLPAIGAWLGYLEGRLKLD
jgi:hypothetical protein